MMMYVLMIYDVLVRYGIVCNSIEPLNKTA